MEYSIKIINNKEYAILPDGTKYIVRTDEERGKYISVDNTKNDSEEPPFNTLFSGRIKDAVETIREGNGDVIQVRNLFGEHINVLYFLDREIGEKFRQQSIDGWKNSKFGYVIAVGNKNSMSGLSMLKSDGTVCSPFFKDDKPIIFNTADEAISHINKIINKAEEYVDKYNNDAVNLSESERGDCFSKLLEDIEKSEGSNFSVVLDIVVDMMNEDLTPTTEHKSKKWVYSIQQYCSA